MEDLWNILVPVMVIGGIFASVIAEQRKNIEKRKIERENIPDMPQPTDTITRQTQRPAPKQDMPGDYTQSSVSKPTKVLKEKKSASVTPTAAVPPEKDAYSENTDEASLATDDIRRAMIAHEILKRKF